MDGGHQKDTARGSADHGVQLFPAGLIAWAGYRDGGVRKPFRSESGRPTGTRIHTPLLSRLQAWSRQIAAGEEAPRTLLLVGGPGNGKTDAIETCIEFLDADLKAEGQLVAAFKQQYEVLTGKLPPRKAVVEISPLRVGLSTPLTSITLVQDATERDVAGNRPAEELLIEDLHERLAPGTTGIYLCCVNRGILAHAATMLESGVKDNETSELLNTITAAVTSAPHAPSCWPLKNFNDFAVWPMDVESLVDAAGLQHKTVAHQIFEAAIDESRWVPGCKAGPRCPFCQNRRLLAKQPTLDALIRLLRYYELASGKRWTFRDLFSLVPYLLVGDFAELRIRDKLVSPCEWAAWQLEAARNSRSENTARARAPYLLVSRLYYHRLFPRWPALKRGKHWEAKRILERQSGTPGVSRVKDLFNYLAYTVVGNEDSSGELAERIKTSFSEHLDPAVLSKNMPLLPRDQVTVNEVEEAFSLSVKHGLTLVYDYIEPLERDLLKLLVDADEALVEENFPRIHSHSVARLKGSLRAFCARLVKRSIGTRQALCRNAKYFDDYEQAIHDPKQLVEVKKQLRKLLHDEKQRFHASLTTTFGQPLAQRSRDVVLLTRQISIKEYTSTNLGDRPPDPIPYLVVAGTDVPITFPLFKALKDVLVGLDDASLPSEIFALLNGIKSVASGRLVRDEEILNDESLIVLGASREIVEYSSGNFQLVSDTQ